MIPIIELAVFGFLGLSVVYLIVSAYFRSTQREKLENEWDGEQMEGDRDAFIEQGMARYEHGLRKRLIWLVYIIPMVIVCGTVYWVNYQ